MSFHVPENQTVSFTVYCQTIANKGFDTRKHGEHISKAFDRGEPLWMVTEELKLIEYYAPKPTRTPLQIAALCEKIIAERAELRKEKP